MNTLWAVCPLCGPRAAFLKAADFVCLFISLFIYYLLLSASHCLSGLCIQYAMRMTFCFLFSHLSLLSSGTTGGMGNHACLYHAGICTPGFMYSGRQSAS